MKYYLVFFGTFLCVFRIHAQEIGSNLCKISYDVTHSTYGSSDTIEGVDVYVKKSGALIFEWPNMVGPVYIFKKDSVVSIDCTGSMVSTTCDSLDFFRYRFATVLVDLRTCSIEKHLNRMDYLPGTPEKLCAIYQPNLLKYRSGKRVRKECPKFNYARLYSYQLMYAAVMGSVEAKCLFQRIKKDYRLFDQGLDAVEYRMNTKIIQQLSPIGDVKCQDGM